jgi:hypothetical protein
MERGRPQEGRPVDFDEPQRPGPRYVGAAITIAILLALAVIVWRSLPA